MSIDSPFALRLAAPGDTGALEDLIALSTRVLQAPYYSREQIDGALGTVFAVDRQLIADATYFVAHSGATLSGCGGWSRRKTLFGGDAGRDAAQDALLDPSREAARIRAFFVRPDFARRGIGTAILNACEEAAANAGFTELELVATLAGVPLYRRGGFRATEPLDIALPNGLTMPALRMRKSIRHTAPATPDR
jgi:GNAT superfamily N-acetyltransferase